MANKKAQMQSLLGWLVSIIVLLWVIIGLDWSEVWINLKRVSPLWFLPLFIVTYLGFLVRAYRWRFFLVDGQTFKFSELMDALMLGQFANFFLPLRAGEFIRPWLLTRSGKSGFASYFASIVLERFFDLSFVLLGFALFVQVIPGVPEWAWLGAQALLILAGAILTFILIGSIWANIALKIVKLFLTPLPERISNPLLTLANNLLTAAATLKNPKNLFAGIILTVLVWAITIYGFSVPLSMFGIAHGIWEPLAVTVIVALAVAAPTAPGFLGVFQAGCTAALAIFGISNEIAIAYSILVHLFQYLFITAFGLYILMKRNLNFKQIAAAQNSSQI